MSIPKADPHRQRLLAEALQLARQEDTSTVSQRLAAIQTDLQRFTHRVHRQPIPAHEIPVAVREAFVEAAIRLVPYQDIGGSNWQGTLNSPTLEHYRPDPLPIVLQEPTIGSQLCELFQLSDDFVSQLQASQQQVTERLAQQKRIMAAAMTFFQDSSQGRLKLFQALFGPLAIPAEIIDCIHTPLQFYFCLPYKDGKFYSSNPDISLPDQLSESLQSFLHQLDEFHYQKFDRFPTFGPCHPAHIDPDWCQALAKATGDSPTYIARVLSRAVGIIPTHKMEAFLIHDVWGHHWQYLCTQFASDYAILKDCGQPLHAGETAYTSDGPINCRMLFQVQGDQVELDHPKAHLFFHGEVQQRLGLLFTHLIAEMIADAAEFKFVWDNPHQADQLLSSSVFKDLPTKLDLTLADIDFLFLQVLRPLVEIHLSALEETPLETDLLREWGQVGIDVSSLGLKTSLKAAIAALYQIFFQEYNTTYLPTLTGESSLFTDIVSNLLYLQNVLNELYTEPINKNAVPFQDLLLLFVGCYCSSDSYAEFWSLDDALAAYYWPCWHLLNTLLNIQY
ncbi:hypothetical protein [Acaryochloris sp. CCMEE 5410]|uniref:hypothetical protein n=1 Tax=Acaryochloris sp. CCMEE 5410 TaxID=310037 RepID=UPI0002483DC0|nr:hypothetical protein [Acaryochloris sp. CCMEE 5410]KAI9132506.1 hypothetical protein ON05_003420 [Acaryochloris sp. CCMEE 5410]